MSRQIISTTRADGTRSTYTLQPGSTVPMQLEALKPLKPSRIKADRRTYPKYKPGMSTADYVAAYEAWNNSGMHCDDFWQPLNTAPAAGYVGIDTVEHGDFDQIADDAPALPDVAELAPVAPAESEPVADAVPAELAPAAAPVDPVPADLVADALADLVAIGWTAGPYPRTVCQLFDGVGPLGTMVTPNGTRRVIVSADDVGQLRATLGPNRWPTGIARRFLSRSESNAIPAMIPSPMPNST